MSAAGASTASSAVSGGIGGRLGVLHAHLLHVLGVGGLALLAGLVLAAVLIALLAVLLLFGGGAVLAHVERFQEIVDGVAELALVLEHALEPVEAAAGAILDERPPQVDELLGRRRRRLAGQPLAHHHGDGLLDRRVGAVGDLVELAAMEAVVEHGGEIALRRRACGASRSPRRGPARPRRTPRAPAGRRAPAGDAPRDRGRRACSATASALPRTIAASARGELARRLGQPHLAADQAGPLGGERNLELGLLGDGAQAAGDRPLERLGRRFLLRSPWACCWRTSISRSFPHRVIARCGSSSRPTHDVVSSAPR